MYYGSAIKILVMLIGFYYIKTLNIPDSYKFLLTVIPSLLLLSTNYVIKSIQYAGKTKPITVKRSDDMSDKPLTDEYFFESFSVELQKDANAVLYENEKPFWIQSGGYLDISNPNNFIKVDNVRLSSNYTLEFWLRLKYLSNNNIASFYSGEQLLFQIMYDDKLIYINQSTKIPYEPDQWAHVVIMRGKSDLLGNNLGNLYINGIFTGYINDLPNLQEMNMAYLFKNTNAPMEYNKNYHDLSNCSVVRMYDRSLTIDEIQNNYLKDAYYFGKIEEEKGLERSYVKGSSLVFYMESRIQTAPIRDKSNGSFSSTEVVKEKPIEVMYNISREPEKKTKKPKQKQLLKPVQKEEEEVIIVGWMDEPSDDWIQKAEKEKTKFPKRSVRSITLPPEEVALNQNWLDAGPKDKKETKDTKAKPEEKEVKKVEKKEDNTKGSANVIKAGSKPTKEVKTSKPIF
jgi:hypothetical protein